MNILDLLSSLIESPASAKLIPQDPEAATLLNQAMPAYGDVIRAAQEDPRTANIYAGPAAQFLGRSTASGFYAPTPSNVGMGVRTSEPNTLMIGPPLDPNKERHGALEWLGMPVKPGFDPEGLRQQTLAHELGHFLINKEHPTGIPQEERMADVIAANPDMQDLQTMVQQGIIPDFTMNEFMQMLLSILGERSGLFTGPRLPENPLTFEAPKKKRKTE